MASSPCSTCNSFCPTVPLTKAHWAHLESLLCDKKPLSDAEYQTLAQVQHDIDGYEEEIIQLETKLVSLKNGYEVEITQLETKLVSLKNRRDELKEYASLHKPLLAPIHKLPNEILVEILLYVCSPWDTLNIWVPTGSLALLILRLGVCRRWYSLVTNTPPLWSHLGKIVLWENDAEARRARMYSLLQMFLERSKDSPLSFEYFGGISDSKVSHLLAGESHRWSNVGLRLFPLNLLTSGLPNVITLRTSLSEEREQPFRIMPSLRTLALEVYSESGINLAFPWSQLTDLSLENAGSEDLSAILPLCTHLVSLRLVLSLFHMATLTPFSSSLSFLAVCDTPQNFEIFFQSATLSRLTSLEICGSTPPRSTDFPVAQIISFLSRSQCHLTDLSITSTCPFTTAQLTSLLSQLPSLTNLTLHDDDSTMVSNDLLRLLLPTSSNLLSQLTHLDLSPPHDPDFDCHLFTQMVQSRWDAGFSTDSRMARLKSVKLLLKMQTFTSAALPPLVNLKNVGLATKIHDCTWRVVL